MGWMNSLLSDNEKTEINVFYSKLSSVKNYSINHSVIRLYEPNPNVRKSHIPKQLNRKKTAKLETLYLHGGFKEDKVFPKSMLFCCVRTKISKQKR